MIAKRKGFVIGLGFGFAPWAHGSWGEPAEEYDQVMSGANFLVGYAWNNQSAILLLIDEAMYEDTLYIYRNGELIHQNQVDIIQAFVGFGYSHYFAPQPNSPFITVGIGLMEWVPTEDFYQSCHAGPGILLGGGYELTHHLQLYGSFKIGKATEDGNDYTHSQLLFTLTGVLY